VLRDRGANLSLFHFSSKKMVASFLFETIPLHFHPKKKTKTKKAHRQKRSSHRIEKFKTSKKKMMLRFLFLFGLLLFFVSLISSHYQLACPPFLKI